MPKYVMNLLQQFFILLVFTFFTALSNWHNRQIAFVMNASRVEFATIL